MSEEERPLRVGIGLIARGGRYLVRQRPPGSIMEGVWEFPGGKCEPGESPEHATMRECFEETGRDVSVDRLRRVVVHRYPHGWIELSFFDCSLSDDAAEPAEGSGFVWIDAADLRTLSFPGANEAILDELCAPG
ncbi:MAG: (deoxy)nucleoside triphosphate pyrophosphohydrolase [Isosphaeraceae bacterium]|nr:(deoxy)nucleoside triphosphate pyrophosphohydrolase [Isosphaeraceae bacterium]